MKELVAAFPLLSFTVMACEPAAKFGVKAAALTTNWNTEVPCSVTAGLAGIKGEIVV